MANTKEVSFKVSEEDFDMINRIAHRAHDMHREHTGRDARDIIEWQMDFTACHANGNPLDLQKLLDADDFNFAHDAFGIARKLNRDTGELTDFFSPRCSARG